MTSQNNAKNAIRIVGGKPGEYPLKLELIPKRLIVTIYHHQLPGKGSYIPCWTFVTEGFRIAKQKEFVLTLKLRSQDHPAKFPKQPLQLFTMLFKLAMQKKRFEVGDVLRFGGNGLLGFAGAGFTFVVFSDSAVKLPVPSIAIVLLKNEECSIALDMGLSRVLSRLGYEMNRFPLNPWNDLERNTAPLQSVIRDSILGQSIPVPLKFCSAVLVNGDALVLVLPAVMQPAFAKIVVDNEQSGKFSVSTQLFPCHQGTLVWLPDKDMIEMNMDPDADGEMIAGSFIWFQRAEQNGASMLEDGFQMLFDDAAWLAFKNAVMRKQNITIAPGKEDMQFCLYWKHSGNPELLKTEELNSVIDSGTETQNNEKGIFGKIKGLFRRDG